MNSLRPLYLLSIVLVGVSAAWPFRAIAASERTPRVVVDIPAIHSLVSQVMGSRGTPVLLLRAGGSEHHYALRPSDASALADATLVFWTSAQLTPWLDKAIDSLAADARVIELARAAETRRYPARDSRHFQHEPHEHSDPISSDDSFDAHVWLDPRNARQWLGIIAHELARQDPENGAGYEANAASAAVALDRLDTTIDKLLADVRDVPFVVFHDSYQYLEKRYGLNLTAAVSPVDGSAPSADRLQYLRTLLSSEEVKCVFADRQFDPALIATITEGTDVKTGWLDPTGTTLKQGPQLYSELMMQIADNLHTCLHD